MSENHTGKRCPACGLDLADCVRCMSAEVERWSLKLYPDLQNDFWKMKRERDEARAEVERLRALIRFVASGLTVHGLSTESAELLAMADGVPHVRLK